MIPQGRTPPGKVVPLPPSEVVYLLFGGLKILFPLEPGQLFRLGGRLGAPKVAVLLEPEPLLRPRDSKTSQRPLKRCQDQPKTAPRGSNTALNAKPRH